MEHYEFLLKEYTEAFGVSGCEREIRQAIMKSLPESLETHTDKLGNLITRIKGNGKKVMLAAHMDEVGFIVKYIGGDGRIKFAPVGGIDSRILISKRVVFLKNRVIGVIGSKPIHLQGREEASSPVDFRDLYIDIGADSKEEAMKYVRQGDYAAFDSCYVDMGRFIKSRALDDRVGCAIITELLEDNVTCLRDNGACLQGDANIDLYGVFTVMEEAGLRGAGAAAFAIEPDIAIVIEGTTCADIACDEKDYVTTPGMGPAISIMDRTSAANGKFLKKIVEIADKNNIPYQFRRGTMGGNDAGRIHRSKNGCITATISVPTRYIHSPISMINKKDFENTLMLVRLVLECLNKGEF